MIDNNWSAQIGTKIATFFSYFSLLFFFLFSSLNVLTRYAIEVQSGKTKRKIRENNEHLVLRLFTSNNNEQLSHVFLFILPFLKTNRDWEAIRKNATFWRLLLNICEKSPQFVTNICWNFEVGEDASKKRFSWFPDWIQKVHRNAILSIPFLISVLFSPKTHM